MDEFLVKVVFSVLMAFKAEFSLGRRCDQEFLVCAGMGTMAGDAVAGANRSVPMFFAENVFLVAVEA